MAAKRLKLKIRDKVEVSDERLNLVTVRISKVSTMPPSKDAPITEPPKTTTDLEK